MQKCYSETAILQHLSPLITVTNTDSRTRNLAFVYFCSPTRKDDWLFFLFFCSVSSHTQNYEKFYLCSPCLGRLTKQSAPVIMCPPLSHLPNGINLHPASRINIPSNKCGLFSFALFQMDRFKASKAMLSDMESSFDDTVLAVRRNRDDLTPLTSKSMKLKVCTRT